MEQRQPQTPEPRSRGPIATEGGSGPPLVLEPIVFQHTLYYPGNVPLVITAGHGGSHKPGDIVQLKTTHRFVQIPDLPTTADPITIDSFARPVMPSKPGEDEIVPRMSPRDQSQGGNFKKDLNTHAMALNLATAISCLTRTADDGATLAYSPATVRSIIPEQEQEQAVDPYRGMSYPHIIVFRVSRLYVDVNRNLTGENAIAEGDPMAEAAWLEYHDLISHVQAMALQQQQQDLRSAHKIKSMEWDLSFHDNRPQPLRRLQHPITRLSNREIFKPQCGCHFVRD
ncbi:hypothetical protein BGX28_006570 [Mortierella sp. GBA30]|nr:hypothetical protein BGX28_006570 [Mortierella sp. GBA30]